jgi:hypothetical protein
MLLLRDCSSDSCLVSDSENYTKFGGWLSPYSAKCEEHLLNTVKDSVNSTFCAPRNAHKYVCFGVLTSNLKLKTGGGGNCGSCRDNFKTYLSIRLE